MILEHIDENLVRVTMRSCLTGNQSFMDLPIREGQIHFWQQSGELIQNIFPNLSAGQREFLMTGITPEEWDDFYGTGE